MSTNRPDFIDLRSKSQASVSRPLRSPRLHVAGEAPPELSPLDAFAMQSRLLKKQLEDSAKQGRRMSRLPPLTTDSPLVIQGRSDYFRSLSAESGSEEDDHGAHPTGLGLKTEVEDDLSNRPKSMHPRMSGIPPPVDFTIPLPMRPNHDGPKEELVEEADSESFFGVGARREQSPPPMEDRAGSRTPVLEGFPQQSPVPSFSSPERLHKIDSFEAAGLVPPRPMFTKRTSSLMSSSLESTDEDGPSSLGSSFHSLGPRKMSNSSMGVLSPGFPPYQRSPSISSDTSGLPRPSFNFSRPMSRVGTPSFDPPARQASSDSHASFLLADDSAHTPVSMHGDGFPDAGNGDRSAAPSYIYSKYSLPRGKVLQRSPDALDEQAQAQSTWEGHPITPPSNVQTHPFVGQPPPSPPTRPSSSAGPRRFDGEPIPRPSLEPSKLSIEVSRLAQEPTPNPSRPSTDGGRPSEEASRGRPSVSSNRDGAPSRAGMSTTTSDSASTIKPARSQHSVVPTMSDLSAEEHVNKAVALHEAGSLRESTYHLRHAANQGHPTGMLLYALACRHGWGMKANQREGVEWLRKAAESASLEIADDEEHAKEGKRVDVTERKTRKAQFALSVYELGVSHMNGWGIEQDKALALRCFEIAGSWGDVDALAEAGFCYAQGVGCKKNLKKSAKFYREAEAKGMSMVGNSWIHKAKYDSDNDKASVKSEKANRSKSKPRKGFFSRKSSA